MLSPTPRGQEMNALLQFSEQKSRQGKGWGQSSHALGG
jgi:hypothetical protein